MSIGVAAAVVYAGTFGAPFVLDDRPHILDNPYLRAPWPPWNVVFHTSRPLVGLSLALNAAMSGMNVASFHAFNLFVHIAAAWALYAVVRLTLEGLRSRALPPERAGGLALAIALLWVVHPLQTAAVTYVIQRGEVLAGLFTLLVLYTVARSARPQASRGWEAMAWACCACGMASKPIMVIAPVLALIYDRVFCARSWTELWRGRGRLHAGLFCTMLLLPVFLSWAPREWSSSAGAGTAGVSWLRYASAQPFAILHYLRLSFWPDALCLDYGWPSRAAWPSEAAALAATAAIVAVSARLIVRGRRSGFLGAAFVLLLLPSSSVIPIADPVAEHRMYLPLAALVAATVLGADALLRRLASRAHASVRAASLVGVVLVTLAVAALASRTIARNRDYATELSIWSSTVRLRPEHPRPHNNLGMALLGAGRRSDAVREFELAVRRDPNFAAAQLNLGRVLFQDARYAEARGPLQESVRLDPSNPKARTNLGLDELMSGRFAEAERLLAGVVDEHPAEPEPYAGLALALAGQGRDQEAVVRFGQAIERRAQDPVLHVQLGSALLRLGERDRARAEFQRALELDPGNAAVRSALRRWGEAAVPVRTR